MPNRLYRTCGDSTFEDITDQAGVRRYGAVAFVDIDNDGDQISSWRPRQPAAVHQRREGISRRWRTPSFSQTASRVLTSITMADYRDGFVDPYLCLPYFFGAGEDRRDAGAAHARNGPPGVLPQ
jgi:hypothetical protein